MTNVNAMTRLTVFLTAGVALQCLYYAVDIYYKKQVSFFVTSSGCCVR